MTPQAQEIVDRFRKILFDGKIYTDQCDDPGLKADTQKSLQCAIVAVEMVLAEFNSMKRLGLLKGSSVMPLETVFEFHTSILTELKNEL